MAPAPSVGEAFFPLDEELGLLSGGLTPRGEEMLVRLASWMPFEQAQEMLEDLVGIQVSKATARRATLQTGQAALAVCEAQEERLKQEVPQAPAGADKQLLSADGAMVHLVGGEWAEVQSVLIGEVTRNKGGEVCTQQISSFSRLADAERFTQAALVETQRRGVERAREVCAVQDGAQWLQGVVDYHRADALRILDFAHAASAVSDIGEAVAGAGGRLPTRWLEGVLHRLKHQGAQRVLKHLARGVARYPSEAAQEKLTYLHKRETHMQYPTYQAAGWPIGSGSVESANKGVVEARLKGTGMRWDRHNVNRMLVLRNAVCNQQWTQTWRTSVAQRRQLRQQRRHECSQQRLTCACWTLAFWKVRLHRLSQSRALPSPSTPAAAALQTPARRPVSAYSWRKPFLRRPPSTSAGSGAVCAKK